MKERQMKGDCRNLALLRSCPWGSGSNPVEGCHAKLRDVRKRAIAFACLFASQSGVSPTRCSHPVHQLRCQREFDEAPLPAAASKRPL